MDNMITAIITKEGLRVACMVGDQMVVSVNIFDVLDRHIWYYQSTHFCSNVSSK